VVKKIENKTKTLIISAALVLAILSGIAYMAYANAENNDTSTSTAIDLPWSSMDQHYAENNTFLGPPAFGGRCGREGRRGLSMMITVSEEFKENVLNITESDSDVQQLLADGYNVTYIRPIIETIVEGDGSVVTKATSAVVMLEKDTTGYASVWVDLEAAKVTRIVIITRTVIDKT
jgi:Tfp pilus assembly protein PilE